MNKYVLICSNAKLLVHQHFATDAYITETRFSSEGFPAKTALFHPSFFDIKNIRQPIDKTNDW